MNDRPVHHVFFDVGGVLGTNGWDREQRAAAIARFDLDSEEFEYRHQETVSDWEAGRITIDDYLDVTVFHRSRAFDKPEFVSFMTEQSQPNLDAIALARQLAARHAQVLMTLNNEAEELNVVRIRRFELAPIFTAFLSSCWLGLRKPKPEFFRRALCIAQADPATTLFIDDREQNLEPARALGVRTLKFTTPAQLAADLQDAGLLP